MTIKQIYDLAVRLGIQNDLRGSAAVHRSLAREKRQYDALSAQEKAHFDRERLTNPYSDTRVYAKDLDKPVKRVLAGIDMETAEMLLAHELSKTKPIDLVISHHPMGSALAGLHEVMHMQAEILSRYGIPINVAEGLLHIRISEISRKLLPGNHYQELDTAKLLGINVMTAHTVTDNMVANRLQTILNHKKKDGRLVGDVFYTILEIPEYQQAEKDKMGPVLFSGSKDRFAGRVALTEFTGGTEGSPDIYQAMARAGVGTVVSMHQSEEHKKNAEKSHVNVIIAGHMSSDSFGMNLFLDELEKRGVEVIPTSGLIRVSRNRKKETARRRAAKR